MCFRDHWEVVYFLFLFISEWLLLKSLKVQGMKYVFVSLHASPKSSGDTRPTYSKQIGFGIVSIFRCLIWGIWKRPNSKGGFSAWWVFQKILYIYICSLCAYALSSLSRWVWFLLWMSPTPLNGIKTPDSKSCIWVGGELTCLVLSGYHGVEQYWVTS